MNISIFGLGYVGCVSVGCLSNNGHRVIGVDVMPSKVELINQGKPTIIEKDIDRLIAENWKEGRASATTNYREAVLGTDVSIICVGTPSSPEGHLNLTAIYDTARQIGESIREKGSFHVVAIRSTVLPGTNEKVGQILEEASGKKRNEGFAVVSNPEFLREGVAVDDFMKPDRVVIGTSSKRAQDTMRQLYEPFVRQGNPIYFMDERSAEMTKYAANSYLATRISFMNEIANLCEIVGADVDMVRLGMGSDTRIGKRFLFPGVGYGGSCFPKDVQALALTARQNGYDFQILNSVMNVNTKQKQILADKIINYFDGNIAGKAIAIWGLAFKPNTDDIREAPALAIIDQLLEAGAKVKAFDPEAMDNVKALYDGRIEFADDQYEALIGADALAIVTEWHVFRSPSYKVMHQLLSTPAIFDGRNIYDAKDMAREGFYYDSIGRKKVGEGKKVEG